MKTIAKSAALVVLFALAVSGAACEPKHKKEQVATQGEIC